MARILIAPRPETGHLHGTLGLARALARRGHEVSYASVADLEPQIRAQGFGFLRILEAAYPPGHLGRLRDEDFGRGRLTTWWRKRFEALRLFDALVAEPLADRLRAQATELVIADRELPALALRAYAAGVATVTVSTTLPARRAPGSPPYTSGLVPAAGAWSRARSAWAWQRLLLRRRLNRGLGRALGARDWRTLYRAEAARCGFAGTIYHDALGAPDLALPQLVLCPRAFDFPTAPPLGSLAYGAAFVDVARAESGDTPPTDARPLVLCSLGSQSHRLHGARRFFVEVVRAFAARPGVRLMLAVGRHFDRAALGELPANVSVHETVAQLACLRRAALMITHGGLNSIKECVHHGVPMLVTPLGFDQPGNAARVAHHGLGLTLALGRAHAAELGRAVDELLEAPRYRAAATAMQRAFVAADRAGDGLSQIESLLPHRGGHQP